MVKMKNMMFVILLGLTCMAMPAMASEDAKAADTAADSSVALTVANEIAMNQMVQDIRALEKQTSKNADADDKARLQTMRANLAKMNTDASEQNRTRTAQVLKTSDRMPAQSQH